MQIEIIDKKFFEQAARIAEKSLCKKDRCGAVIVKHGKVIGTGYNAPPLDDLDNQKCDYDFPTSDREKPKSDCTCCVHAEWRALIEALESGVGLAGSILYFTRIDDTNTIIFSGDPYCTVCSRLVLDARISFFVLWHEDGPVMYDTKTYNHLSYQFQEKQKSLV